MLKKILLTVFVALMMNVSANADDIKVFLNNQEMTFDVAPQIINDRTFVPMRAIFEALGAEVSWEDGSKTATGEKAGLKVETKVGNSTVLKNGQPVEFDAAPVIEDSRVLVPVRVIAECLGAVVSWDNGAVNIAYTGENVVIAHFLDVGQGDCEFVELPNGDCMLIDASTAEYAGFITDYIKELGYSDIDYLIATHPHADHIGGMTDVINSFDIGAFYMPNAVSESKTFERMMDAIEAEGCEVIYAKAGVNILTDTNLSIDILSPVKDEYDNLNNYSAVIKLVYGDTSYLFTGDAEKEVEYQILFADIEADVLKVGHHGSSTSSSSEFIKKVNPEYAVISCGLDNSYGHPHDEVVSLYNQFGIKTYVTYETGNIVISSDSENLTVESTSVEGNDGIGLNDVRYASSDSDSSNTYISYEEKEETQTEIVYKTKTGGKYHKAECSYLKSKIEITLKDAVALGLEPCNKCF